MNVKDNQKYQETETRIKEAFFKIIENQNVGNIEISEICRLAGIHRTTFYGHYSDAYELTNSIAKEYIFEATEKFMFYDDGIYKLLQYIKNNMSLFTYYYRSGLSNMEKDLMSDNLMNSISKANDRLGSTNELETFYNEAFYRKGIEAIIKRWIYRKCKDDPRLVTDIIIKNINKMKNL